MSISAKINVAFKVESDTYTVNLDIPTSTPTADEPFNFNVESQGPTPDGGTAPAATKLLSVAVGASSQVYVAVSPPKALLDAAVPDLIEDLDVVVQEGTYDVTTNKFTA